ncbi:MAG: aminoglycoside phosphotransferase family protein [Rhizomicrobium sp.]
MAREDWTRTAPVLELGADEAHEMLRPALGDVSVLAFETLNGGHANTNIRVRLGTGSVVLRLYQRDPAQPRKEAAIARLVAGCVPAPAYLHCGVRADGQVYAVVEWIDGAPLQQRVGGASAAELNFAGREIGRALAAIHGFTFEKAGFLDGDLTVTPFPGGGFSSDFLEATLAGIAGERLGRALAADVIAFAKANAPRLAAWTQPPRLTHFDFGSSNILVRDDFSLAGIIDWEFAASASPPPDFGNLLRPPLGQSEAFVEGLEAGYRDGGGVLPADWRELVRIADLSAWADLLSRPAASDALIEDARQILRRTITPRGRAGS